MKEFFKDIILNLYIYIGNRQAEKMEDEEIEILLNKLCKVSKIYNYIPEDKQKEIIEAQLLKDKEYQNINVRLISKWLEENGKIFFTQQHHEPTIEHAPATDEQREQRLKEWEQMLANTATILTSPTKGNGARMREQLDAVAPRPPQTETTTIEETKPTYFCLMTNICKLQCDRCRAEEEITKGENPQNKAENKG